MNLISNLRIYIICLNLYSILILLILSLTHLILLIILCIPYLVIMSSFYFGLLRKENTCVQKKFSTNINCLISLIIPIKNEYNSIPSLISSIKKQSLSQKNFEILFVNDHSADKSIELLKEHCSGMPNYKIINQDEGVHGKKAAIQKGVFHGTGELIVTTDADCKHHKNWLISIYELYAKNKFKLIIAPVIMEGNSLFGKLQSLEFLSLSAATAGAAGIRGPIMCNGANLAFQKSTYEEFKENLKFEEVSGDDVFLLHAVKTKYPNDIHYLKSENAIVKTFAENSFKNFFQQRIRWASKARSYRDKFSIITSLSVFNINFALILLPLLTVFNISFLFVFLIIITTKGIIDFLLLLKYSDFVKQTYLLLYFPLLFLIYPYYIIFTAIIGLTTTNFKWKQSSNK